MKKLYYLIILCFFSQLVTGQHLKTTKADKYLNRYQFYAAAQAYEKALKADSSDAVAIDKLVQCYLKLNNTEKAEFWLSQLVDQPGADARHFKTYAAMLASNSKYNEALTWYTKSYESLKDAESLSWINSYKSRHAFHEDYLLYQIRKVHFNSEQADFSPAYYGTSLVFCSARDNGKSNKFAQNNTLFVDLYQVKDTLSGAVPFSKTINSVYHEGPVVFTASLDTMYFTRNNYLGKKKFSTDGVSKLKIYYATQKNGEWEEIQEFALNNNEYSVGHPALAGQDLMYFVSDMPGGFGGTDLYKTERVNGLWQQPVNLGPEINTSGNEMFPYVDEKGTLYFASNGHPGLGGLDIFYCTKTATGFGAVKNFGSPINSPKDDFGLIIKSTKGYFSSNRNADPVNDNIYSFSIHRTKPVWVLALDESGKALGAVDMNLSVTSSEEIKNMKIGPEPLEMIFEYGEIEKMMFSKSGYVSNELKFVKHDFFRIKPYDTLTVTLKKKVIPKVDKLIHLALIDAKGKAIVGGSLKLTDLTGGAPKKFTTKNSSPLPVRLAPGKSFEVLGSMEGFNEATLALSEEEIADASPGKKFEVVLTEKELFAEAEIGQTIELEIKYDLGKANIRPTAAKKLDKLVEYLKEHPTVKVELGSHTDSRGSAEMNQALSQRRAESAVKYVTSKGISRDRLVAVGFGKNALKIVNAKNEEEHQQNRRTTIKIIAN